MSEGMDSLVRSRQRLMQAERDAIAGLVASSVAHDFNNVLTVMNVNLHRLLIHTPLSPEVLNHVRALETGARRLAELSQRMRSSGRAMFRGEPLELDVGNLIDEAVKYLHEQSVVRGCELIVRGEYSATATVMRGYPILLHQLLMNLILNAAEATQGRGKILVEYTRESAGVVIEVHDNGPGIPVSLRESVFGAFFTTKKFGTGLGLVSVKNCVDAHGGTVEVADSPLGGACFRAILPDLTQACWEALKMSESLNKSSSSEDAVQIH
jgi:signal transduction histidine kinase